MYFKPIFNVGDYISPIKKSIFCELCSIGRIISINALTYIVKTKKGKIVQVHIQFQEYYRNAIPNKQQEISYESKRSTRSKPSVNFEWGNVADAMRDCAKHFFELGMTANNKEQKGE